MGVRFLLGYVRFNAVEGLGFNGVLKWDEMGSNEGLLGFRFRV